MKCLVIYEFCKKAVSCGVDIFRVFDSLNYDENLKLGVDAVVKAGGVAEGAISYTGTSCHLSSYLRYAQSLYKKVMSRTHRAQSTISHTTST
jgi:pyruvate carboxylase